MYRFRNTEFLLGKYKELEKQEIYFASQNELNDPMEGFFDTFWRGDQIVWKNFIVNYTYSLEHIFKLFAILGESKKIVSEDILLTHQLNRKHQNQRNNENLRQIIEDLFDNKIIQELPQSLSKRNKPIRRNELIQYLIFMHTYCLNSINKIHIKNGFGIPKLHLDTTFFDIKLQSIGNFPELVNQIENENKGLATEELMTFFNIAAKSIQLSTQKIIDEDKMPDNLILITSDFPQMYVKKIVDELYPPWYSASFISDYRNSSVWGHYADKHKGVCLKFKTTEINNELTLKIEREYGISDKPLIDFVPKKFMKIEYQRNYPEIDYFRSLGRMNKFELENYWYKDNKGNLSACGSHLYEKDESKWINQLWGQYYQSITKKLIEWEYEKEYRLIIEGDLTDYSNKDKRKLKYDFNDLESIIFGINTAASDKMKIMKIIDRKCSEHNRNKFDFYQAYYSTEKQQIELNKFA